MSPRGFHSRGQTAHVAWARTDAPVELLLLHGISDSADCWTPVLSGLADERGVLATDARGHGGSGLPEEPFDYRLMADDAALVLTELGVPPVAVLGHSMGAMTAAVLAQRHPDRVRCLVLEDPPAFAPSSDRGQSSGRKWSIPDWLLAVRALDHDARIAQGRADNPGWSDDEMEPWAVAKEQLNPHLFDLPCGEPAPLVEIVAEVRCPTLLVTGDTERGALVTPEVAQACAAAAGGPFEIAHIDGAGHSIRRDRRDAFVSAVDTFLRRTA